MTFLSQIWNVFVRQPVYVLVTGRFQVTNCKQLKQLKQLESSAIKSSQEWRLFSLLDKIAFLNYSLKLKSCKRIISNISNITETSCLMSRPLMRKHFHRHPPYQSAAPSLISLIFIWFICLPMLTVLTPLCWLIPQFGNIQFSAASLWLVEG